MAKNTDQLPYTELVERTREIARIDSLNDRGRARGAVNDIYVRKLPAEEDWGFLIASSAITCNQVYNTGTVTVTTQASAVTFSSDAVLTAGMTGRKIKFNDNANVYDFTQTNTTAGTISPVLSGDLNISAGAYTIFSPLYALAANFDRFPKRGGLLLFQGGKSTPIPEESPQHFYRDYTPSASLPQTCRLVNMGTDGVPYVELSPPPLKAINLPYEYLQRPTALSETTAGTATVSGSGVTITFQQGARIAEATTGWYFRIDAFGTSSDSEWYRIIAFSIANSTATIQTAFGLSGATSAAYTLCAAPQIPVKMQPAILYGAVVTVTADQNDALVQLYQAKYAEIITDGKRTYKSRLYDEQFETVFEEYLYRR